MSEADPSTVIDDGEIAPGRRLVRAEDRGLSLGERIAERFYRLTWRTPLHGMRLDGRYPLKLLAVPADPLPGDVAIGQRLVEGMLIRSGERIAVDTIDFAFGATSPGVDAYLQRFDWLRDLAAGASRERAEPVAELLMRRWIARHGGKVDDRAWAAERIGWRLLNWAAHAPLILSSTDIVYRSAVLNALARGARHLDREADRARPGLPRITGWAGVVASGLLIPGGEPRRAFGETGLVRALGTGTSDDGGIGSRDPGDQVELVELIAMLRAVYDVRQLSMPEAVQAALDRGVAALLGVQLGDGALSSWQGAGPIDAARIRAAIAASGVRTRPLRHARDWGYQRLVARRGDVATIVVADMAPPPPGRASTGGSASTLAFELSDGAQRLIVNCGGVGVSGSTAVPADLMRALRSTAAHSTLTLADNNSTAIQADGSLGAGVGSVEIERGEIEGGSRIEASHDGYARRFGLLHKRSLTLSASGSELRGEDALLPSPRGRRRSGAAPRFAIRFHLAPGVEVTPTADGLAALLRIDHGPLWQFRCRGGALSVEDSLWIDADGVPHPTRQFVIEGEAPPGGASVNWLLKRAG